MSVLLTTTLPTIVGMAVITKATTTMFGEKRRRAAKRRPRQTKFKIYQGPKGGQYILRKGKKVYI